MNQSKDEILTGIKTAIEAELTGYNFYNELAEWEEEHFKAFEQQLDALKEEYFQANNFIPL
jgi:hypothetical protein